MDISVIIVNYNTAVHLEKCLNSLFEYTVNSDFEVIVVDNNSPNRDIKTFPARYPSVKFYFRNKNEGFGTGCNFGAQKAHGKHLLFINPDVMLFEDILGKCKSFLDLNAEVGAVSPVYQEKNGNVGYTYNYFPDIIWEWYESFGIGASNRIEKLLIRNEIKVNLPFEVDWVMGSFIFLRKDIFERIHGFDESFFLYYEDIDLQYRIRKLGYKIICCPDLRIKHFKRASVRSYYGENLFYYHMTRSNLIYMYKHFGFIKRNLSKLFHITGIIFRIISIPFRIKFRGKKTQKFEQYRFMLKFYLIGKEKIIDSRTMEVSKDFQNESMNSDNDEFWKI